jgi:serine/threonine protein kinase
MNGSGNVVTDSTAPPPSQVPGPDDPRLVAVLEEYRALLEAGHKPDRQPYLERYPDLADALSDCFDGLEFVFTAGPDLRASAGEPAASGPPGSVPLGDYRVVREIGRGGMGVVYEAEQMLLGRRVALKVLPFAATMDARHLQRFHNEARAAACLHHPHIVPVHAVGCERGVHYYAMQFIEGRSLAEVIADLKAEAADAAKPGPAGKPAPPASPGTPQAAGTATPPAGRLSTLVSTRAPGYYQAVARLGIQAAQALHHAHEVGVLHRDIKPANLMLDSHGSVWVTDFGLAQIQGDTQLTMTGDLVGTLRYMSPEQALAKRVLIDHRTDIYSLGVTLYELLTLQPAYAGTDRQELLRQIAFDEPLAPRRRNRAVPAELETIVLKAVEKNPADRYATAKELADDLRSFTEDQPIRARRPSIRERTQKWARRHKGLVRAFAVVLVLAVVALAVSTVLIWQKNEELREAYEAEAAQKQRASDNLHVALEALEKVYLRLTEDRLPWQQNPDPRDRELLERLLSFYLLFSKHNADEPTAREAMAKALLHIGVLHDKLGDLIAAEKAMREGIQISQQLVDAFPATPRYREILVSHFVNLGQLLTNISRDAEAEEVMRAGIARCQEAMKIAPSLALQRCSASLLHNRGVSLSNLGRSKEAEEVYLAARTMYEDLIAKDSKQADYHNSFGGNCHQLAEARRSRGEWAQAKELLEEAIRHEKIALDLKPNQPAYLGALGNHYTSLAYVYHFLQEPSKAEDASRQSITMQERVVKLLPHSLHCQGSLAFAYISAARLLLGEAYNYKDCEDLSRKALAIAKDLEAKQPGTARYQPLLVSIRVTLASALLHTGQPEEAEQLHRENIRYYRLLAEKLPRSADCRSK